MRAARILVRACASMIPQIEARFKTFRDLCEPTPILALNWSAPSPQILPRPLRALRSMSILPQTAPLPRSSWRVCPRQMDSALRRCRTRRPHGTWGRRGLDRKPGVPLFDLLDPLGRHLIQVPDDPADLNPFRTRKAMMAVSAKSSTSHLLAPFTLCDPACDQWGNGVRSSQ